MDIFKSEKAPYILGLLVTVIGWHVTQIVNEISETQAVSYSLEVNRETGEVSALIRNVSRTKSLVDATFTVECARTRNCFAPLHKVEEGEDAPYGRLEAIPPNGISRNQPADTANALKFTNTVAAGGRYRVTGRLVDPNSPVEFYYLPTPDVAKQPLDIYLYKQGSVLGFFVEHYLALVATSLAIFVLMLVYSLTRQSAPDATTPKEAKNGH